MNKDNEKNKLCVPKLSPQIPKLLIGGAYYRLLPGTRWDAERKELCVNCNSHISPPTKITTWKNRFHNPSIVPKNNAEYIYKIMEEELAASLQRHKDTILDRIKTDKSTIISTNKRIALSENELLKIMEAIEIYKTSNNGE